jgi:hypothetical protein
VVAQKLVSTSGRSPATPDAQQGFAELVRRALIEVGRRKVAALWDDHSRAFFDTLFDPSQPAEVTFAELCTQFVHLKAEDAAHNGTSQKYLDKVSANLDLIREVIGDSTLVRDIDYDDCLRVRSVVARTPTNRTKIYPGLSLAEAITRSTIDGRGLLSPVTQGQYLGTLRELLELAHNKGLIEKNFADGLKPIKRDSVPPEQKRPPFTEIS